LAANKPRAVVSGGAGFIGSHLCEALLARDTRVLALDNFITGSPQNLRHLQGNPDFEFRQADVNHGVFIGGVCGASRIHVTSGPNKGLGLCTTLMDSTRLFEQGDYAQIVRWARGGVAALEEVQHETLDTLSAGGFSQSRVSSMSKPDREKNH